MNYPRYGGRRRRFFFAPFIVLLFFVLSALVMLLWNSVLPDVLHTVRLTYWQAAALLLLSRILFGSMPFGRHGGGPPAHVREKWAAMNDEERSRFKDEFRRRHHPHHDH